MELDRRCHEPQLLPDSGGGVGFDGILATWAERVLMWAHRTLRHGSEVPAQDALTNSTISTSRP